MIEYRFVSADSHVNEAPDTWEARLPAKLRERGPRLVRNDDGHDLWVTEGLAPQMMHWTMHAAKDRLTEGETFDARDTRIDREEMVAGSVDPHARLKDMEIDGLDAEVLYPGMVAGLSGSGSIFNLEDTELRHACIRAYNDWLADFCRVSPDRLAGLAVIHLEEPEFAAHELQRAAEIGLKGAIINGMPDMTGAPPITSAVYDPVWSAAEEVGLPLSLHIINVRGLDTLQAALAKDSGGERTSGSFSLVPGYYQYFILIDTLAMAEPMALLICSGVLERHPKLRFTIAEAGIGWIPYSLERLDYGFRRHRNWAPMGIKNPPSEYFHQNFAATFQQDDMSGLLARSIAGVDNLMWASDYPHSDSTWPRSKQVVDDLLGFLPADERQKITVDNAVRLYFS